MTPLRLNGQEAPKAVIGSPQTAWPVRGRLQNGRILRQGA
ncbi:hypothetical protein SAMCCGM7_pC0335 (plasmid) [Sinorhizobium americanum CCGM7]|nr:hypothetical protein SAMCCGM7_pC0335 [Sinorhizobium americanum CCGM7]